MDMARTSINLVGNCLATVVMARWEGSFDTPGSHMPVTDSLAGAPLQMPVVREGGSGRSAARTATDDGACSAAGMGRAARVMLTRRPQNQTRATAPSRCHPEPGASSVCISIGSAVT